MVWFNVDDNLGEHLKVNAAGLEAMGLWVVCGSFCARYPKLEGFVPRWYVEGKPRGLKLAAKLAAVGLWHPCERDDGTGNVQPGWQFHEWLENGQRSNEEVERDRASARERQRRRRGHGVTNAVTPPVTNAVSHTTQAIPSHTKPSEELPTGLEPAKSPSVARASQRAQRLNPAWVPDPADHKRMHFTDEQATEQLASFRDYWCSRGRDAARLDWQATWRNWLRNTDRRRAGTNGHKPSTTSQRVNEGLELAAAFDRGDVPTRRALT